MKLTTKRLMSTGLACCALAAVHGTEAQTTIGFDDYNTAVAGTDYVSRVFAPDNNSNTGFGGLTSPTFPSSNFDLWGIAQRDSPVVDNGDGTFSQNNGEPFDVFDNSLDSFPGDVIGYNSIGTDGFVAAADTVNGSNSTPVSLNYVFDITGYENLQVSMDWGAFGDFEDADSFLVLAGVDGGTQSTIMQVGMTTAQDDLNDTYTLTMASGTVADIYFDPFYSQSDWDNLIANGPSASLGYHPDDDGTDGDDVAQDGFIPEPTALNADNETRAYADLSSGFNDQQVQAYTDPMRVTTDGFATSTALNNILTTAVADVAGTGDTLELTILGTMDGSVEYVVFDNLAILGDVIGGPTLLVGDADNDGDVDAFDITAVEQNFGSVGTADGTLLGDADDDGDVDAFDITAVEQNFGNVLAPSVSAVTAVPEPSSLALLGLGGLLVARRRRK